jgi:hypothetical protein
MKGVFDAFNDHRVSQIRTSQPGTTNKPFRNVFQAGKSLGNDPAGYASIPLDGGEQFHGDCLEVLRTFPPDLFDVIMLDPYFYWRGADEFKQWAEDNRKLIADYTAIMQELRRVLHPKGTIFGFANFKSLAAMETAMFETELSVYNRVVWFKTNGAST